VTGSPVVRTFDRAKDGMLWEEGVDTFLEWVKRERRAATYDDYRKTLRAADCSRFKGRLLKSITDDDIRKVRDDIDKRAPSQAQHTLRILKSCLAYLADTGGSGIKSNPAAVVRQRIRGGATEDEDDESRARVPTIEEVGQLAWNIAQAKNPVAKMGAALVMMTAQRPRTVRSARIQDFEAFGDNEGIWTIPRPFMKSHKNKKGRPHVIPLPPVAWHIVQQAIALAPPGSKWLFPQQRPRRAGDKGEGHISHKPIGEAMRADGGEVTPHELRKAFGTHGEPLCGWTQRETKMVLDHDMGESGDVTAIHYSLHNGTHVTWSMLRRWEAWVLAQTAKQAPIGSGPVPAFMRTGRKG
jgi:integrase